MKHILFVDDEPGVFDGLRRMLHRHRDRWRMSYAESVDAALVCLSEETVHAVITDYAMPGRDGFDLLRAIHAGPLATEEIPVIVLTGSSETSLKRQALDLGATDLISKPIDPADLVARLSSALRVQEANMRLRDREQLLEAAVQDRTSQLESSRLEIIFRLAMVAEYRDETTGNHVIRVGTYARLIAESIGLPPAHQADILLAAPLHDLGKVAIPDRILLKQGELLPDEWDIMRSHCRIGHQMLTGEGAMESRMRSVFAMLSGAGPEIPSNPMLDTAGLIALTHHERWDGTGYPDGLEGEAIPLVGRITAVADVFDALTSERPYKSAMSIADAVQLMKLERGRHFDPQVLDAFIDVLPDAEQARHDLPDSGPCDNASDGIGRSSFERDAA